MLACRSGGLGLGLCVLNLSSLHTILCHFPIVILDSQVTNVTKSAAALISPRVVPKVF